MAKLQEMFSQARRAQNGGGMGFLGKSKAEAKAHAAALVVELPRIKAGEAEAAIKAGADGLLFTWDGNDLTQLETLKLEAGVAKASNENTASGLTLTGNWDNINQDTLKQIKDAGIQYIVLPFNAPARLLSLEPKELEKVVTVPMRTGEIYPLYIGNLTAFDAIAAVLLDFSLSDNIGSMSIEQVLDYRAVREAVRYPAFLPIKPELGEADIYTVLTLGIQGLLLQVQEVDDETRTKIKDIRELLIKVHKETKDKEKDAPSLPATGQK